MKLKLDPPVAIIDDDDQKPASEVMNCPWCFVALRYDEDRIGLRTKCPQCRNPFIMSPFPKPCLPAPKSHVWLMAWCFAWGVAAGLVTAWVRG